MAVCKHGNQTSWQTGPSAEPIRSSTVSPMQAARLVVKILKGIQPSEIPVETPEGPMLVINRTTAKTIGLKIPREFLEQVDRVVK